VELRIAFIGFGKVAQAFARMIESRRDYLLREFDLSWRTMAIATANHGSIFTREGIDLTEAVAAMESGANLHKLGGAFAARDPYEVLERCPADILFETTTLNPTDGEPAATFIRQALERGINVVTANKGPVAFAYRELKTISVRNKASFRFEGAVMDGAPVFNLAEYCLPAATVKGFAGVLNSTTNVILEGIEEGRSFEESLSEAQRIGVAEANADYDIDGWDACVKAVVIAKVLMEADIDPRQVARKGIRGVRGEDMRSARNEGMTIRLVARGWRDGLRTCLSVSPERVPLDSLMGSTRGTSNALILETDLMGEIAIVEKSPGVEQTAYALLSDMLRIRSSMSGRHSIG
jgi:homoserine dehydrogenase